MINKFLYTLEVDSKVCKNNVYSFKGLTILSLIRFVIDYLMNIDDIGCDGANLIITKHLQK